MRNFNGNGMNNVGNLNPMAIIAQLMQMNNMNNQSNQNKNNNNKKKSNKYNTGDPNMDMLLALRNAVSGDRVEFVDKIIGLYKKGDLD